MNYHNIPFYIASESIKKSKEIGKIISRQNNTHFKSIDIPEIYTYLKRCNNFTCFVLQITEQKEILDNIVKSINQKNPIVAAQNPEFLREKKMQAVETRLADAVDQARLLGIGAEQLIEMLQLLYGEGE